MKKSKPSNPTEEESEILAAYDISKAENIDPNASTTDGKSKSNSYKELAKQERHFEAFMNGDFNPEETDRKEAAKKIQAIARGKRIRKSLPELKAEKKERDEFIKAFGISETTYDRKPKRSLSAATLAEIERIKSEYEAYESGKLDQPVIKAAKTAANNKSERSF